MLAWEYCSLVGTTCGVSFWRDSALIDCGRTRHWFGKRKKMALCSSSLLSYLLTMRFAKEDS